jgi:hypothetical protein
VRLARLARGEVSLNNNLAETSKTPSRACDRQPSLSMQKQYGHARVSAQAHAQYTMGGCPRAVATCDRSGGSLRERRRGEAANQVQTNTRSYALGPSTPSGKPRRS